MSASSNAQGKPSQLAVKASAATIKHDDELRNQSLVLFSTLSQAIEPPPASVLAVPLDRIYTGKMAKALVASRPVNAAAQGGNAINLTSHSSKRSKGNKVKCRDCGRSVSDSSAARTHIEQYHRGKRLSDCFPSASAMLCGEEDCTFEWFARSAAPFATHCATAHDCMDGGVAAFGKVYESCKQCLRCFGCFKNSAALRKHKSRAKCTPYKPPLVPYRPKPARDEPIADPKPVEVNLDSVAPVIPPPPSDTGATISDTDAATPSTSKETCLPNCQARFKSRRDWVRHVRGAHRIELQIDRMRFDTHEELRDFIEMYCNSTACRFDRRGNYYHCSRHRLPPPEKQQRGAQSQEQDAGNSSLHANLDIDSRHGQHDSAMREQACADHKWHEDEPDCVLEQEESQKVVCYAYMWQQELDDGSFEVALLPKMLSVETDSEAQRVTYLSMQVIFPIAAVLMALSLGAVAVLRSERALRAIWYDNGHRSGETAGTLAHNWSYLRRIRHLILPGCIMLLTTAAITSYMCALAPRVPTNMSSEFWVKYLPTMLLVAFSLSAFIGRAGADSCGHIKPLRFLQTSYHPSFVMLLIRIAMLVGLMCYVDLPRDSWSWLGAWSETNTLVLLWFALASFLGGFHTVTCAVTMQHSCEHSAEGVCTTTAQMTFLSLQIGSCIGMAFGASNV
ncbi:uncharacterized protein MONBRDRAFT_37156 [Monosiga brevicollis MX1]|uniref:C2H2-type domain-containing protein n=1 Tax=Monosiga brevicollis TaxID=81824 RepID=A9UZZ0_MONBE|nr:uncharacterized protein MONBRDRAFT_37156 [Monosiga brevicollis MX1]EDQ88923.1 predicted protein [Monosiga brevicollis MX1]|eukprot:XP_001746028.1 hypothetical protein [Monosiga brevicollis MX1]